MKRLTSTLLALNLLTCLPSLAQKSISVTSPNGQVTISITLKDRIYYDVISQGETLMQGNHLALQLSDRTLGAQPALKKSKVQSVKETVKPVLPVKAAEVQNDYTMLTMNMKGGYALLWRVYDDGFAYRFTTALKDSIHVLSEDVTLSLAQDMMLTLEQCGGFRTSCEEPYSLVACRDWKADDKMSEIPIVMSGDKQRIFFCEYDLHDYPGLFLKGNADGTMHGVHPQVPLEWNDRDGRLDRSVDVTKEADYIAYTNGTRTFPWRYFVITQDDRDIANNTMPMRLAPQSALSDISWIKTGKTTWEWWNGSIPYGEDVNFESGLNLDTYKYFVDFAAKKGLEYILMDEGWARNTRDPFTPNPDIDLQELIRYANSKGVGIILWMTWLTVDRHMDLFETFEKWGIKGVKIDFMDRQDQWMVNFYERVTKKAAEHHLFVDFHGAFHPNGLEYTYPNIVSFEGVRGMEQMGGCKPENSVYLPFVRNAAGIMDYTPGAMLSAQPYCYSSRRPNSASIGTRAYQMALYVLFETRLQMLADNPSLYLMWEDCADFMCQAPVLWDETRVLAAEYGQYVVTAKRSGNTWYIGGITNETPRDLTLDLSFLPEGVTYEMTAFVDGPNAKRQAMDYRKKTSKVSSSSKLTVNMANNGGIAATLTPQGKK